LGEAGGTLSVRQQLTRSNEHGGLRFTEPKSEKSRGSVGLSRNAVDALKRHKAAQTRRAAEAWILMARPGPRLREPDRGPLGVGNLTNYSYRPLLERAGLPEIRFHDLRHTCATLLLTRNVNPNIVQETLGPANISETMDTYPHVLSGKGDTAAGAMDEALS